MQGKVTLEDHFAIEATLGDSQPFGGHVWPELRHRLLDFQEQRLRLMDETGVEIMIASLNAPAVQAITDVEQAAEIARRANDVLAEEVAVRKARASLPFSASCWPSCSFSGSRSHSSSSPSSSARSPFRRSTASSRPSC